MTYLRLGDWFWEQQLQHYGPYKHCLISKDCEGNISLGFTLSVHKTESRGVLVNLSHYLTCKVTSSDWGAVVNMHSTCQFSIIPDSYYLEASSLLDLNWHLRIINNNLSGLIALSSDSAGDYCYHQWIYRCQLCLVQIS